MTAKSALLLATATRVSCFLASNKDHDDDDDVFNEKVCQVNVFMRAAVSFTHVDK